MKASATDKREFLPLLEKDYEDVGAFAEELLAKAFSLYEQHDDHGLLFQQDGVPLVVRGFTTELQAAKWAKAQGLAEGEAVLTVIRTQEQA